MSETNKTGIAGLERLSQMFEAGAFTKAEAAKFIKTIQEFVLKLDSRQQNEINMLRQAVSQLMIKIESKFDVSLTDLKGKVDGLFVGDRVKKLEDDHSLRMKGVDERMAQVKDGRDGLVGLRGLRGERGSPDTAELIRNKLEILKGDERLDASAIKGLENLDKDIKTLKARPFGGGGISQAAARDLFVEIDLTGELDGATTEFNIPAVWRIIAVELSSYPGGALRNEVHFTYTPTTIKFLDTIDQTSQLKSDQHCKILAIRA